MSHKKKDVVQSLFGPKYGGQERERERVTRVRERESLGHLEINWQSFDIVLKFGFGQFGQQSRATPLPASALPLSLARAEMAREREREQQFQVY